VEWLAGVETKEQKQAYLREMQANMNANQASLNIMNDLMMNSHVFIKYH